MTVYSPLIIKFYSSNYAVVQFDKKRCVLSADKVERIHFCFVYICCCCLQYNWPLIPEGSSKDDNRKIFRKCYFCHEPPSYSNVIILLPYFHQSWPCGVSAIIASIVIIATIIIIAIIKIIIIIIIVIIYIFSIITIIIIVIFLSSSP